MSTSDRLDSKDRVYSGAGAGGGGSTPSPGGSGTSVTLTDNPTNNTGSAWSEGALLAPNAAGEFVLLDATNESLLTSRFAAAVTESGGIANGASGEATSLGRAKVLFKAGLTLQRGDRVYGSTTPGEATNGRPGGGGEVQTNPLPSGAFLAEIGWIEDASSYGVDRTALCVLAPGPSRRV